MAEIRSARTSLATWEWAASAMARSGSIMSFAPQRKKHNECRTTETLFYPTYNNRDLLIVKAFARFEAAFTRSIVKCSKTKEIPFWSGTVATVGQFLSSVKACLLKILEERTEISSTNHLLRLEKRSEDGHALRREETKKNNTGERGRRGRRKQLDATTGQTNT